MNTKSFNGEFDWLNFEVKMKDKSRIRKAMREQDEVREKSGKGDLSGEVRKWRDKK